MQVPPDRPLDAPFVVRLPTPLVERVRREALWKPNSPYRDLGQFLVVAAENLLALEANGTDTAVVSLGTDAGVEDDERSSVDAVREDAPGVVQAKQSADPMVRLPGTISLPTSSTRSTGRSLFVLTNRFSPMALGVRVLANLTSEDGPPSITRFALEAGRCAREVGLRLKREDGAGGIRAAQRRFVGWPVGEDESKSLHRFQASFLLWDSLDNTQGPMAECCLAAVDDGKVFLTQHGVALAKARSPVLGETEGWTLGDEQQGVLRSVILDMPEELGEVTVFLEGVEKGQGDQGKIHVTLQESHPDWSPNRVTAHRAALLGRLREIGVVDILGWGPTAVIKSLEPARLFLDQSRSPTRKVLGK